MIAERKRESSMGTELSRNEGTCSALLRAFRGELC